MTNQEIRKKLDPLLKQLANEKTLDVAESVASTVLELLDLKPERRYLVNFPRVDAELPRFELAPNFDRQAAAFDIPVDRNDIFDPKLFWIKKTSKTNLSWLIGLAPNFEDSEANDYKSIGIDFVIPSSCDSVIILLSNKYKVRSLELKGHLTHTQYEIFTEWTAIDTEGLEDTSEIKRVIHSRLWESFDFEPINRKFYLELVEHFSLLVLHLEKTYGRKHSVMFTTRLIGRILFIWFLRKKGLVNQAMDYFNIEDPLNQSEYYKKKLEVLFFETLNKEIAERTNGDSFTPYLNGGLFDASETDFYGDQKLTFPNGFFSQLFDTLSKYNFTVDESSPEFQQVAVDPEMLGRIFECLLAEQIDDTTGNNKKKATGAFYTPREIVGYMCEQSVIEFFKKKLPDSPERDRRIEELVRLPETIFRDQDQNKRRDWKPYTEALLRALKGDVDSDPITILDPAVGSGAFPMGMLHLLVKIYTRLDSKFEKNVSQLKRDILSKSLYGVDIEQTAIEICRLRAWLSIIVDVSIDDVIEPLPNLDFKFACANTLIPLHDDKQQSFFVDYSLQDKLMGIRDEYFSASKKSKKVKLQKEYEELTKNQDLFDDIKTRQLKSYKPFDIGASSEFYDPKIHHGIEFFDIIIGNPPYVGEKGNKDTFQKIAETTLGERFYERRMDLFYFFFHISLDYLRDGGILSFITTNYFITATGGKKLRKDFKDRTSVLKFINFGELRIFESALGQHNMITILEKSHRNVQAETIVTNRSGFLGAEVISSIINKSDDQSNFYNLEQTELYNESNIKLTNGALDNILDKLKQSSVTVGDVADICQGIITSADKVKVKHVEKYPSKNLKAGQGIYILSPEELQEKGISIADPNVKPWFKNSDISKYWAESKIETYLLYFKDLKEKQPISKAVKQHFDSLKEILIDRLTVCKKNKIQWNIVSKWIDRGEFYLLFYPRKPEVFEGEKIIAPQRSKKNTFGYTTNPWYASADVYFITNSKPSYPLKFILGVLNSRLIFSWLHNRGKRKGDMLELYQEPLAKIPLPTITDENRKDVESVIKLVDTALSLRASNKDVNLNEIEDSIEKLVCSLFNLSEADIESLSQISKG